MDNGAWGAKFVNALIVLTRLLVSDSPNQIDSLKQISDGANFRAFISRPRIAAAKGNFIAFPYLKLTRKY